MATAKQILDARAAGYSNAEIAQHLGGQRYQKAKDAGYSDQEVINHFLSPGDQTLLGNMSSANGKGPLDELSQASGDVGRMVEAGGAGLADLGSSISMVPDPAAPSPSAALSQATSDIANVEQGQPPTSTAGSIGKTIGSFFTPNQIALQALGGAVAKPIATGLGNVATPVIKGLVNAFPKISDALGASPEAVSALAENPGAVSMAKSLPETAQNVAGTVQGLSEQGMDIASAGKAALSDETPVVGLRDKLMNYAANIARGPAADEADQAAADYVSKFAKNLELNPSESDIGEMIDDLDEKINMKYNKANPGPTAEAKIGIRRLLSQALQGQNPQYAKAMSQSAATFEPTEALSKSFGVEGGNPSDRTINALRNKSTPDALATQRALGAIPGLSDTISSAVARDALQKTLLGKLGLFLAPKIGGAMQGGVQALPIAGNAAVQTVQGLTQ